MLHRAAAEERPRPGDRRALPRPAGDQRARRVAAKLALVESDGPFFTIPHFDGYNAVLVQRVPARRDQPRRAGRGAHRGLGRPRRPPGSSGNTLATDRAFGDQPRLAAYDVLRAVSADGRLRQPGAAAAAARARAHRPRRGVRDRAGRRHAARPGHVRRRARVASTGRWPSTRRCSTRCGSAPTSCSRCGCPAHAAVAHHRRPGPAPGRAPAGRLRQRGAAQGVRARPRRLGATGRPRPDADPTGHLAVAHSHPRWVVEALAEALGPARRSSTRCCAADNERPEVTLVARPGCATVDELGRRADARRPLGRRRSTAATPARCPPCARAGPACRTPGRSWSRSPCTRAGRRPRRALARPVRRPRRQGRAARGAGRASAAPGCWPPSVQPHRARLVRQALPRADRARGLAGVVAADGTRPRGADRRFDRVLVDAPCTGLGALRRRPESRWRRRPTTSTELVPLQRALLDVGPRRHPARGSGRLRDLLAGARRDRRRRRRRCSPRATTYELEDAAPAAARGRRTPTCARLPAARAALAAPARHRRDVPGAAAQVAEPGRTCGSAAGVLWQCGRRLVGSGRAPRGGVVTTVCSRTCASHDEQLVGSAGTSWEPARLSAR